MTQENLNIQGVKTGYTYDHSNHIIFRYNKFNLTELTISRENCPQ